MFELPEATVHSIISKMIIKEELLVSLRQIVCVTCAVCEFGECSACESGDIITSL